MRVIWAGVRDFIVWDCLSGDLQRCSGLYIHYLMWSGDIICRYLYPINGIM